MVINITIGQREPEGGVVIYVLTVTLLEDERNKKNKTMERILTTMGFIFPHIHQYWFRF